MTLQVEAAAVAFAGPGNKPDKTRALPIPIPALPTRRPDETRAPKLLLFGNDVLPLYLYLFVQLGQLRVVDASIWPQRSVQSKVKLAGQSRFVVGACVSTVGDSTHSNSKTRTPARPTPGLVSRKHSEYHPLGLFGNKYKEVRAGAAAADHPPL